MSPSSIQQSNYVEDIESEVQERQRKVKEMKLIRTFTIIFLGFTLGFLVLSVGGVLILMRIPHGPDIFSVGGVVFGLSSVVNPLLTMGLQHDFQLKNPLCT